MEDINELYCDCGELLGTINVDTREIILEDNVLYEVTGKWIVCRCPYCKKISNKCGVLKPKDTLVDNIGLEKKQEIIKEEKELEQMDLQTLEMLYNKLDKTLKHLKEKQPKSKSIIGMELTIQLIFNMITDKKYIRN